MENIEFENNDIKKDELISYINATWKNISLDWHDVKSQKFEEEYLKPIKEKIVIISQNSNKFNNRLFSLEEYVKENI